MLDSEIWFDAAFDGELNTICKLIQSGFDVDTTDGDNRTALHIACCEGHIDLVALLLRSGARHDTEEDRWGNRPLKCAVMNGHVAIKSLLEDSGAYLHNECRRDLEYKLCRSASQGKISAIQTLVENGLSVNTLDYGGRSLLHLAAANGHTNAVDFLLKRGANIDAKDACGLRPIDVARIEKHHDVEETIQAALETMCTSYFRRSSRSTRPFSHMESPDEALEDPCSDVESIVDGTTLASLRCSSAPAGIEAAAGPTAAAAADADWFAVAPAAHPFKRRRPDDAPPSPKRPCQSAKPTPPPSSPHCQPALQADDARPAAPAQQCDPELGLVDADVRSADAGAAAAACEWERRWAESAVARCCGAGGGKPGAAGERPLPAAAGAEPAEAA